MSNAELYQFMETKLNSFNSISVIFDSKLNVALKWGEKESIKEIYKYMRNLYKEAGFYDMANDLSLLEDISDLDELYSIFTISGYLENTLKVS